MLTDPISEFLTRVRNASHAGRSSVTVRSSNMIKAIAQVLATRQFIKSFYEDPETHELTIALRADREALELRRLSKPGQRLYVGHKNIRRVRNGLGISIISTSKGLVADDEARAKQVGGELICEVF